MNLNEVFAAKNCSSTRNTTVATIAMMKERSRRERFILVWCEDAKAEPGENQMPLPKDHVCAVIDCDVFTLLT